MEGPDCWVTFAANGQEHWLQCTLTRINMDWPFSSTPEQSESLRTCFCPNGPLQIHAWEVDTSVTLTPAVNDVEALVRGIDSAFRDLYGLGPDYTLAYTLETT